MINMTKAQGDIISAVIIIIIAMGLVGTAYSWGLPLIQKKQDTTIVNRVLNYFDQNNINSLPSLIERVANIGDEETFSLDVNGVWILREYKEASSFNNSLTFSFSSKVSNLAIGQWISLTTGASCPPSNATLGIYKSSVVCARADPTDGGYNITYMVLFRELDDSSGKRGYKIDLNGTSLTSTGKDVRISRGEISSKSIGQLTLIETIIKVIFE
jgi:hypothetical protein